MDSKKGFVHLILIIGIVLVGILLVVPFPHYQRTPIHCKDDSKCPNVGWSLRDPLVIQIYKGIADRSTYGPPSEESHIISPTTTPTNNWKTYRNEEYGFGLMFTDEWEGMRVQITDIETFTNITFEVPYNPQFTPNDGKPYPWFVPFYIKVHDKNLLIRFGSRDQSLGSNDKYQFHAVINENPSELKSKDFKVDQILSTFEFIE